MDRRIPGNPIFVGYVVMLKINKLEKDRNYLDELVKLPEDELNLKEVL